VKFWSGLFLLLFLTGCTTYVKREDGTKIPADAYVATSLIEKASKSESCKPVSTDEAAPTFNVLTPDQIIGLKAAGQAAYYQAQGQAQTAQTVIAVAALVRRQQPCAEVLIAQAYFNASARKTEANAKTIRTSVLGVSKAAVGIKGLDVIGEAFERAGAKTVNIHSGSGDPVIGVDGAVVTNIDDTSGAIDIQTGTDDAFVIGGDGTIDPDKIDIDQIGGNDTDAGGDPNFNLSDDDDVGSIF